MSDNPPLANSFAGLRVPAGRLSRASRIGGVSARIAGAVIGGGAREILAGRKPDPRALLLTPANARRLTEELARMRGAAMKMGQLLSMEASDLLPAELAEILARLRDDAHVMPPAQLKTVLERAYGRGFLKAFSRFEPRPVAAASIGQVHRAETRDGRLLALKIQYPGVRASIDADVSNLGALLRLSGLLPKGFELGPFLDEARRQLHEEADYAREARELARFGALLADQQDVVVPALQQDHCAEGILAMDFVESAPIETLEQAPQSLRDRAISRLFEIFLKEALEWHVVQTDPNFANFRIQPETGRLVLLDFGAARPVPVRIADICAQLMVTALKHDTGEVMSGLRDLGVLPQELSRGQQGSIERMIGLVLEMLDHEVVDFADPRRLGSLRDEGMQLGLEEGFRHIPPWDVLYIQRKLAGLVLLATRLGARVRVRALVEQAVEDAPPAQAVATP